MVLFFSSIYFTYEVKKGLFYINSLNELFFPLVFIFTQIIFFFTPILWQVNTLKDRIFLAEWNPVYHWIEMIRAPLLGNLPSMNDYLWSFGSLIFLFLMATYFLGRYKTRIAYWL
jgi:lipopolysaccharide transport system permease protein